MVEVLCHGVKQEPRGPAPTCHQISNYSVGLEDFGGRTAGGKIFDGGFFLALFFQRRG